MERLKAMKEQLTSCVQSQLGNLSEVNAQELGEAVDMIKDLSEAIYYCSITKAMEENEKQYKSGNSYYTRPIYYDDKEYGNDFISWDEDGEEDFEDDDNEDEFSDGFSFDDDEEDDEDSLYEDEDDEVFDFE